MAYDLEEADEGFEADVGFFGAILTDRGGGIVRRFEGVTGCSKFDCELNFRDCALPKLRFKLGLA